MTCGKVWLLEIRGLLGPDSTDDREVSILNRVVRWDDGEILYEAEPRHVEKLPRDLGMENSKPLTTPGVKPIQPEESTLKSDKDAIDGPVMDITGRISIESAGPNGDVTMTDSDGTYTKRAKYLKDMMAGTPNHNNVDDKSDSVGMAARKSVNMSGLKSSIRRSGATTAKHVTISDAVDECCDVAA